MLGIPIVKTQSIVRMIRAKLTIPPRIYDCGSLGYPELDF